MRGVAACGDNFESVAGFVGSIGQLEYQLLGSANSKVEVYKNNVQWPSMDG